MWLDVLGRCPHPLDADACLCAIGQAEDDLSWYLASWNIADSAPDACHFGTFLEQNTLRRQVTLQHPWKLQNAFWAQRPEQARQVMDWVLAPGRIKELDEAFFAFGSGDTATAELLSEGSEIHLGFSEPPEHRERFARRIAWAVQAISGGIQWASTSST